MSIEEAIAAEIDEHFAAAGDGSLAAAIAATAAAETPDDEARAGDMLMLALMESPDLDGDDDAEAAAFLRELRGLD